MGRFNRIRLLGSRRRHKSECLDTFSTSGTAKSGETTDDSWKLLDYPSSLSLPGLRFYQFYRLWLNKTHRKRDEEVGRISKNGNPASPDDNEQQGMLDLQKYVTLKKQKAVPRPTNTMPLEHTKYSIDSTQFVVSRQSVEVTWGAAFVGTSSLKP